MENINITQCKYIDKSNIQCKFIDKSNTQCKSNCYKDLSLCRMHKFLSYKISQPFKK